MTTTEPTLEVSSELELTFRRAEMHLEDLPGSAEGLTRYVDALYLVGRPAVELGERRGLDLATMVAEDALHWAEGLVDELREVAEILRDVARQAKN